MLRREITEQKCFLQLYLTKVLMKHLMYEHKEMFTLEADGKIWRVGVLIYMLIEDSKSEKRKKKCYAVY